MKLGVVISALLLVAMQCGCAIAASAQSGKAWSAQGSALYVGVGGDGFRGVKHGVGFEAQLRYNFPGGVSLGGGFQRSSHSPDAGAQFSDVVLSGGFVEPRYVLGTFGTRAASYLALRLAAPVLTHHQPTGALISTPIIVSILIQTIIQFIGQVII